MSSSHSRLRALGTAGFLAASVLVVAASAETAAPAPQAAPAPPAAPEVDAVRAAERQARRARSYVIGTYPLAYHDAIIDGDTIALDGIGSSLRLVCIDTEEKYRDYRDRSAAEADFAGYAARKRGDGPPAKFGTEAGMAATEFARKFFTGVQDVRVETDDHQRVNGYYDRFLAHVFANKDGEWKHYNLEVVRAGLSPYFVKYGRSARFHQAFVAAEKEARAAKRGIWGDELQHYPDYDERLAWWNRRADAIERFRKKHGRDRAYVDLSLDDALERLEVHMELHPKKPITLFGTVGHGRLDEKPYLVPLAHRNRRDVLIVAFTDEELERIDPKKWRGEYVYVRGRLSRYGGRLQMKARDVLRIWKG